MSSHLPLLSYINPCFPSFSIHTLSFQFLKNPSSLKFALPQARQWQRLEELILLDCGCARAPLPLPGPLLQEPLTPPTPAQLLAPAPLPLQLASTPECLPRVPQLPPLLPLPQLLSRTLLLLMPRAPPLWPLPKGDIIL